MPIVNIMNLSIKGTPIGRGYCGLENFRRVSRKKWRVLDVIRKVAAILACYLTAAATTNNQKSSDESIFAVLVLSIVPTTGVGCGSSSGTRNVSQRHFRHADIIVVVLPGLVLFVLSAGLDRHGGG